ncbi:MAG: ATP-binding cassette domain-containing protein [bacterium]|nr:ATP-binding cassette domain-containing protein [bacterium]
MIRCKEVCVRRGDRTVLDNVSLRIRTRERWVIWGANGSGKTTLARVLAGFCEPDSGVIIRDPALTTPIPMLFQDPDAQLAAATVRDEIALGARAEGEPHVRYDAPGPVGQRIERILDEFNLKPLATRNPHGLSGGEKRRVNLAALCVLESAALILDEPELHLDPEAWSAWSRLIDDWFLREDRCLLEISHVPERVLEADGLAIMQHGRVVLAGPPREVYRQAREQGIVVPRVAAWETSRPESATAAVPVPRRTRRAPEEDFILRARALVLRRPGDGVAVLNGLDLDLHADEKIFIYGGNGSGKTSLLLLLADLADADAGELLAPAHLRRGLAFQEPERSCFAETVGAEVAFGPGRLGVPTGDLDERVANALRSFGLPSEDFLNRDPFTLSVGEQRRVALAAVFALSPDLLLLDEPGAALDPVGARCLRDTLRAWPGALIWTDCRPPVDCDDLFNRCLRLEEGRLREF